MTTATTIPRGLNIDTKTGPVLLRHHVDTPTWNADPKTPCNSVTESLSKFQSKQYIVVNLGYLLTEYRTAKNLNLGFKAQALKSLSTNHNTTTD